MGEQPERDVAPPPDQAVRNQVHDMAANVVQAGKIAGGVHFEQKISIVLLGAKNSDDSMPAVAQGDGHRLHLAGRDSADVREAIAAAIGAQVEQVWPGRGPAESRAPVETDVLRQQETEPQTLVFEGVDEASDPEAVVRDVLAPVASRGYRLVLGFRDGSSGALRVARELWPDRDADLAVFQLRIERLAQAVDALERREHALRDYRADVAARLFGVAEIPDWTTGLRLRIERVHSDDVQHADLLARAEEEAEDISRRLRERRGELESLLERQDDLRGRLTSFRDRATRHGFREDVALDEHYRRAQDRLRDGHCDLDAAQRLVDAYGSAVRARVGSC